MSNIVNDIIQRWGLPAGVDESEVRQKAQSTLEKCKRHHDGLPDDHIFKGVSLDAYAVTLVQHAVSSAVKARVSKEDFRAWRRALLERARSARLADYA